MKRFQLLELALIITIGLALVAPVCAALPSHVEVNSAWAGMPDGTIVYNGVVKGVNGFATVTEGIANVLPGGDVLIWAGTYYEQVVIRKPMTLEGYTGNTITLATTDGNLSEETGGVTGIVLVDNAGGPVIVRNLKVDGTNITAFPAGTSSVAGIVFNGTSGAIDGVTVENMDNIGTVGTPPFREYGILVHSPGFLSTIEIMNCQVSGFLFSGISLGEFGPTHLISGSVHDNSVIGSGPTGIAKNGIQAGSTVAATIDSNVVSGLEYTGGVDQSAGILFYGGNSGHANNNQVTDCDIGIEAGDSSLAADGNTISGGSIGMHAGAFTNDFAGGNYAVSFDDNSIQGCSVAGILAGSYDPGAVLSATIHGNNLAVAPGGPGSGILIGNNPYVAPAGLVTAAIDQNSISQWNDAIVFDGSTIGSGTTVTGCSIAGNTGHGIHIQPGTDAGDISVSECNIYGNGLGEVVNDGVGTLLAIHNYWGAPCESGFSGLISGLVTYNPWYVDFGRTTLSDSLAVLPAPEFSGVPASGSPPLTVTFTDGTTSPYSSISAWNWSFGDGTYSSDQNPLHTYTDEGSFPVSLTATNCFGNGTETKTNYINVEIPAPPVASFTGTPAIGLAPLTVHFNDTSTGAPETWEWHFGDGDSSADQNPVHIYDNPGIYDVSLTVANEGGNNTLTVPGYIQVSSGDPIADFTATPMSGIVPLAVHFTDLSETGITSWLWDFGDLQSSSEQNPTHTYNTAGTFSVTLTITNATGTGNTTKANYITVTIEPPEAVFTSNTTSGVVPLDVAFTDESTGIPTSWFWDFGDGSNSTEQSPVHQYTIPGVYDVSLTATNAGGSDTDTMPDYITATVAPPVADFVANLTEGVKPLDVAFTDLSTGAPTMWAWDFGDGQISSEQNPVHTYPNEGVYNVRLEASNGGGSSIRERVNYITVRIPPPVAEFTADPVSGYTPLTVNFTDTSSGNPTSWFWDFGDSNTSTLQDPSHVYYNPGTYTVSLTATNDGGSSTATGPDLITVTLPPPVADFTATPRIGTIPLTVEFTDTSLYEPTQWVWEFGDGTLALEKNPVHTYNAPGSYTVNLTVFRNGLSSKVVRSGYITVTRTPFAEFTADPTNGTAPLLVRFSDQSQGRPFRWYWKFGDGYASTERNPAHVYSKGGVYTVTLTVQNIAGMNTLVKEDYITVHVAPVADFTANRTSGLEPLAVKFTDASTGSPVSWAWNFGDGGTSTVQNPVHTYESEGVYSVKLTVTNELGSDTRTRTEYIRVSEGVSAQFSATPESGPVPLTVQFTEQSTGSPISFLWNFGDGQYSDQRNPTHTYTRDGVFTVTLSVAGQTGSSTTSREITVYQLPLARFNYKPDNGTDPLTVQFTDRSVGDIITWFWNFGDGQASTVKNPIHTYNEAGEFDVTLTVTDNTGNRSTSLPVKVAVIPFTP